MIRSICVVALMLACTHNTSSSTNVPESILEGRGGSATPAADAGAVGAGPAMPQLTAEAACARFEKLASEQCAWAERFPPEFRKGASCMISLAGWFGPATPEHAKLQSTVNCWALECEEAASCMVAIQSRAAPPPPRSCGDEGTAPVVVDASTWSARRGATTKRFADVTTSQTEPVEVCGIDGEVDWITRVVCNDGSNPYGSPDVANSSRDSWLGKGGRCNSILDRYSVRCPEATYQLYVDRYVCPR